MKKILFSLTIVIVLAIACKKETTPEPAPAPAPDTTAPTILLIGKSQDTISLNSAYVDPGATANDDRDGNISTQIKISGTVDKNRVGGNYLYYSVKDAAGNSAQKTRYVYVRNEAYLLAGKYNVVSNCGGNFNGLNSTAEVETSEMYNNRIIIPNQQFQSPGFNVTADVNGNVLSMVVQPVGSSLASGTGVLSTDKKSFTLTTTYTPPIQGSNGCTIVYTRQ